MKTCKRCMKCPECPKQAVGADDGGKWDMFVITRILDPNTGTFDVYLMDKVRMDKDKTLNFSSFHTLRTWCALRNRFTTGNERFFITTEQDYEKLIPVLGRREIPNKNVLLGLKVEEIA